MQVLPVSYKGRQCRVLLGMSLLWRAASRGEIATSGSFLKARCVALGSLFSLGWLLSWGDFSRRAVYLALK